MIEKHANGDGTYNGVSFFAEMTGLSEAEIHWIHKRTRELYEKGLPKDERLAIIKEESKDRPWL